MKNLCMDCKERGLCCHYSIVLQGFNVILSEQACNYLNKKTGLCSDYDNRLKNYEHCLTDPEMFNVGGLPSKCNYLIGHPEREDKPKIDIKTVIDKMSPMDIMYYNFMNNHPDIQSIYKKEDLKEMVI